MPWIYSPRDAKVANGPRVLEWTMDHLWVVLIEIGVSHGSVSEWPVAIKPSFVFRGPGPFSSTTGEVFYG